MARACRGGLGTWTMSHAPMWYGEGFVTQATWLRVGFLVTTCDLVVILAVGVPYWRMLGLW